MRKLLIQFCKEGIVGVFVFGGFGLTTLMLGWLSTDFAYQILPSLVFIMWVGVFWCVGRVVLGLMK